MASSSLMKTHLISTAYYNKWAHQQIANFCKIHILEDNQHLYSKNLGLPFKSIRNTLCHIWFAEQLWYCRMIGGTHRNLKLPYTIPRTIDMLEFATYWTDNHPNHGQFENFFDGISSDNLFLALSKSADDWIQLIEIQSDDIELTQQFNYFDTSGKKYAQNQSSIIWHVINHSTHHRGQISGIITSDLFKNENIAIKPIQLDYTYWLNKYGQQESNTKNGYLTPNT